MIDTHVHHFDLVRFRYPWLDHPEFDALRRNYLPGDYRGDLAAAATGLEGWVHVQAEVDHAIDPVQETAWVSELADQAREEGVPGPMACVVYADLRAPDVDELLARHAQHTLMRGVRQEAWFDPASERADIPREDILADPAWCHGYRALAGRGLSFDLLVWPEQLPTAAAVVADNPDVPVVLEHLGLPDPDHDPALSVWRAGVAALAGLPHAHAKLSAFSLLGTPRDAERARPIVDELLERFGPQRCMFGSNFPVERLAGEFGPLYEVVLATLAELSGAERAEVLAGTARRFYRLPACAEP
ncbi:MAG: amidohydrolase family protein [Solirubrobacteraceae bacterium]